MPWAVCQAAWVNTGVGGFEQHIRNEIKPWLNKGEREKEYVSVQSQSLQA